MSATATSPLLPSSAPTANLGLATKFMNAAHAAMEQVFGAEYVSLHVRKSNRAAFNLYTETLGYKIHDVAAKYIADRKDAYDMRTQLEGKQSHHHQHGGCVVLVRQEVQRGLKQEEIQNQSRKPALTQIQKQDDEGSPNHDGNLLPP
ncbi:hypothetical protein SLA2020_071150 [Shorea laevis]